MQKAKPRVIPKLEQTESTAITLKSNKEGSDAVEFDMLSYFAPGMALMFLMYTVSYGGRSILAERSQGTLPRLMVSPTQTTQILGGKVLGIFFMGIAQLGILILASTLFFQVKWGNPLGIIVLILAAVFGATGWGMLITAFARTPAQVGSTGSAIMLIFGILGGSFINLEQMPPFLQTFSKITPNAWGLDGFTTLALGGTLSNLLEPITALLIMGIRAVRSFRNIVQPQWIGGKMKKIFAIAWKDAIVRFTSPSELLYFIILPVIFTVLLAGGTPSGNEDNRIRLLVVDEAQTAISQQIVNELEKSTAVRPEVVSREEAEGQFDDRRASAVFIIPANIDIESLQSGTAEVEIANSRTTSMQPLLSALY